MRVVAVALSLLMVGCASEFRLGSPADADEPDVEDIEGDGGSDAHTTPQGDSGQAVETDGGVAPKSDGSTDGSATQDSSTAPDAALDSSIQPDSSSPQDGSVGQNDSSVSPDAAQTDSGSKPDGSITQDSSVPNICQPGTLICSNNQVTTCTGTAWQPGAICQFGCAGGQCNTCNPGATRCDGGEVQTCNGQEWVATEECGYLCVNSECVDQECTPNEVDCTPGQTGAQCNGLGTDWGSASSCQGHCGAGQADCNNSPLDGCERNLRTDINNCGGCGIQCSAIGGTPACNNGSCSFTCSTGRANCDGLPVTGCEINTRTDINHCGGCGIQCSSTGGSATCNNGMCGIQCNSTRGNCDGSAANGCETALTTSANCGGCGITCNGGETCQAGVCTAIACQPGRGNCDGSTANGCETDTTTVSHCGGCGIQCANYPNVVTSCNGSCQYVCMAGFVNVDGNLTNGCEVNLKTDPSNCGTVGNICNSSGGTASCSAGTCGITCSAGRSNCDGLTSNGCEVNTTADTNNCGGCGTTCSPETNETAMCSASSCVETCQVNWGDCDGNSVNGCELDLTSDVNNCGACGNVCVGAGNTCSSGQCKYDINQIYEGAKQKVVDTTTFIGNTTTETVRRIASDGTNTFLTTGWYVSGGQGIQTPTGKLVKISSGGTTTLFEGAYIPSAVVVRNGFVFWQDRGNPAGGIPQKLYKTPIAGGTTVLLASDNTQPSTIAVDDSYIYWLSYETLTQPGASATSTTIYRVPVNGGTISVLTTIPEPAILLGDSTFSAVGRLYIATWGAKNASASGVDMYPNQGVWLVATANGGKSRIVNGQKNMMAMSGALAPGKEMVVWVGMHAGFQGTWSYDGNANGTYKGLNWGLAPYLMTDAAYAVSNATYQVDIASGTYTNLGGPGNNATAATADASSVIWAEVITAQGVPQAVVRVAPRF